MNELAADLLQTQLLSQGVLDADQWKKTQDCAALCQRLKCPLPLPEILLTQYSRQPHFLGKFITTAFAIIDTQAPGFEECLARLTPQNEMQVLQACQQSPDEQLMEVARQIASQVQRMGFFLSLPEILWAQGQLDGERLQEQVQQLPAGPVYRPEYKMKLYAFKTMKNKMLAPSKGELAVLNKIITREEMERAFELQKRLRSADDLAVPWERLLHDLFLVDRRIIQTLLVSHWKLYYKYQIVAYYRSRLSPEGERHFARACVAQGLLSDSQLAEFEKFQQALKAVGVEFSLCEILLKRRALTPADLNRIDIPEAWWGKIPAERLKIQIKVQPGASEEEILLSNGAVTKGQVEACEYLRKHFAKTFGLELSLGEWLVATGYIHYETLCEVRLKQALAKCAPHEQEEIRTRYRKELVAYFRRRLTPEGERLLLEACQAQELISATRLEELQRFKQALNDTGVPLGWCEMLLALGEITAEQLEQIDLPPECWGQIPLERVKVNVKVRPGQDEVQVLLENGLVDERQIEACRYLQEHFRQNFRFPLSLGEWLVAAGHIPYTTLCDVRLAMALLRDQQDLEYLFLKFSPEEEGQLDLPPVSPQFAQQQSRWQASGLEWSWSDYLLLQGQIAPAKLDRILQQRQDFAGLLRFPTWVSDQEEVVAALGVANNYFTYEELCECRRIQQLCQRQWKLRLPLLLILLRKDFLAPVDLQILRAAHHKQQLLTHWQAYLQLLAFGTEQEARILDYLIRNNLLDTHQINQARHITEVLGVKQFFLPLLIVFWKKYGLDPRILEPLQDPYGRVDSAPALMPSIKCPAPQRALKSVRRVLQQHLLEDQLFGQMAIEQGLVTASQVEQALYVQQRTREMGLHTKLGQIMLDLGMLSLPDIQVILAAQQQALKQLDWPSYATLQGEDYLLCQALIKYGTASDIDVKRCLYIQYKLRLLGCQVPLRHIVAHYLGLEELIIQGQIQQYVQEREQELSASKQTAAAEEPAQPRKAATTSSQPPVTTTHLSTTRLLVKSALKLPLFFWFTVLPLTVLLGLFTFVTIQAIRHNRLQRQQQAAQEAARHYQTVTKAWPAPEKVCSVCGGRHVIVKTCWYCLGKGRLPCFQVPYLRCVHGFVQVKVRGKWYQARPLTGPCTHCFKGWHSDACLPHPWLNGPRVRCQVCNGRGYRICPRCGGSGKLIYPCPYCTRRRQLDQKPKH